MFRRLRQRAGRRHAARLAPQRGVFLHIPKCAGSSVHEAFITLLGHPRTGRTAFVDDRSPEARLKLARGARYVGGHFGGAMLDRVGRDGVSFTFLRDPLDRVISAWRFARTLDRPTALGACETLEQALRSDDPEVLESIDNVIARQLAAAYDYRMALDVPRDEWVGRAAATLERLTYVGSVAGLSDDLSRIAALMGVGAPLAAARANRTDDPDRRNSGARPAPAPVQRTPELVALAAPLIELDTKVIDGRL